VLTAFSCAHTYATSPPHVDTALSCLLYFASSPEGRRAIYKHNLIPYLTEMASRHDDSPALTRNFLWFLLLMTTDDSAQTPPQQLSYLQNQQQMQMQMQQNASTKSSSSTSSKSLAFYYSDSNRSVENSSPGLNSPGVNSPASSSTRGSGKAPSTYSPLSVAKHHSAAASVAVEVGDGSSAMGLVSERQRVGYMCKQKVSL
jgi:hypothetical protein